MSIPPRGHIKALPHLANPAWLEEGLGDYVLDLFCNRENKLEVQLVLPYFRRGLLHKHTAQRIPTAHKKRGISHTICADKFASEIAQAFTKSVKTGTCAFRGFYSGFDTKLYQSPRKNRAASLKT